MGIYYKEHSCGCVTAGSSYEPHSDCPWIEKSCEKKHTLKELIGIDEHLNQAAADQDLCNRLGLTPERLQEIRGK